MATVTKRDIVIKVSNAVGLTQQEVLQTIQETLDHIARCLSSGDEVVLRNFGAFHVVETKAKIGRNPNQPEKEVVIPARAVVKFKPGKEMREKVAKILPQIQHGAS